MKQFAALGALSFATLLTGCVVAPMDMDPRGAPMLSGDIAPPLDYVVGGAPVYYPAEPNYAYYPMYLDFPGSCFCVMPVRYTNGLWITLGGNVVHRGPFNYRPAPFEKRQMWEHRGGEMMGQRPSRRPFSPMQPNAMINQGNGMFGRQATPMRQLNTQQPPQGWQNRQSGYVNNPQYQGYGQRRGYNQSQMPAQTQPGQMINQNTPTNPQAMPNNGYGTHGYHRTGVTPATVTQIASAGPMPAQVQGQQALPQQNTRPQRRPSAPWHRRSDDKPQQ